MKKSVKTVAGLSKLSSFNDFQISNNPRADQANLTNAAHLFGDPFDLQFGDADEDGDAEEEGDADDYGDPDLNESTIAVYNVVSGDPDLYGGPRPSRPHVMKALRNLGIATGAGLTTAVAAKMLRNKISSIRMKQGFINSKLNGQRARQTLFNQSLVNKFGGRINRRAKTPFFQVTGAKMNQAPIDPKESYIADMLKYNLDRQASDTPFFQESAIGVFAAGTWTCTATGVATPRFYTAIILQIGVNQLSASPGTVFTITASLPTINGLLTVSTTPWTFTIQKQFDVRFIIYPWQLVANKPLPVLGTYDNTAGANNIVVAVTGLPANAAVTLVVPGSLHPWTTAIRNALIR